MITVRAVVHDVMSRPFPFPRQSALTSRNDYRFRSVSSLGPGVTELSGTGGLLVSDAVSSPGGGVNFTSPDAWLFFEKVRPSVVLEKFLDRIRVYRSPASVGVVVTGNHLNETEADFFPLKR